MHIVFHFWLNHPNTHSHLLQKHNQQHIFFAYVTWLTQFFDYLIFENYRKTNPLEQIETPRIGRKLPDTLALKEIDLMVASIDLTNPLGERNRAIIETLYSCGLRVSELTDLKISDLFFKKVFFYKVKNDCNDYFRNPYTVFQDKIEVYEIQCSFNLNKSIQNKNIDDIDEANARPKNPKLK